MLRLIYSENNKRYQPHLMLEHGQAMSHPDTPSRVERILACLQTALLNKIDVLYTRHYPLDALLSVHSPSLVDFIRKASERVSTAPIFPSVFPADRCFDTYTPIYRETFQSATESAFTALTGADILLEGNQLVFSLCRPPGHHAQRETYGGMCYFNNVALAATRLEQQGKVAILDFDYHHGNGTQDIFYDSDHVLYVSLHGDPKVAYPFFSGFSDEHGRGRGYGFNYNFPLPVGGTSDATYLECFQKAVDIVNDFKPEFFVVSAGFDCHANDIFSGFDLSTGCFRKMGVITGSLHLKTLVVLEGGYNPTITSTSCCQFFMGLLEKGEK